MSQSIILNNQQINHKIKRIAFEIYENNINESSIILAGISKNGFIFAQKLKNILENISEINVRLCEVNINKRQPLENITTSLKTEEYKNIKLKVCGGATTDDNAFIESTKQKLFQHFNLLIYFNSNRLRRYTASAFITIKKPISTMIAAEVFSVNPRSGLSAHR